MKITILILLTLILTSCNSSSQNDDIILKGKLGKFDGQMTLKKDGDFFNGLFTYKTLNDKKIKLKGQIESNQLRLSEFNDKNEITGLFLGKYTDSVYVGEWSDVNGKTKVPFVFSESKTSINSSNDKAVSNLNGKELLEEYFKPFEFVTDSIAHYRVGDNLFDIEFLKLENYSLDQKQYSIAIFGHYPINDDDERALGTAFNGTSEYSAITFEKNGEGWNYVNQFDNLDIGYYHIYGEYLPKIIQIGNFSFLELEDLSDQPRSPPSKTISYFNVKNFKKSLELSSSTETHGSATEQNVDDFIEETINQAKNYKNLNELVAEINGIASGATTDITNIKYKFVIQNEKLICIVDSISIDFDEKMGKFLKVESTTIYTYDENSLEFVVLK